MEAVAAGDEVAIHLRRLAALPVAHRCAGKLDLALGDDARAAPGGGLEQILLQVRLPIGDEALAAMFVDVDQEALTACPDDARAVVHVPLGVEPLGKSVLAQHIDGRRLEHACADAGEHVVAALPLEDDALDAVPVQDLGEEQAGRPRADDADLRSHA